MMMVFKRKEILVSALVILIGAAAVVNYSYEKKDSKNAAANTSAIESGANDYSVSAIDENSSNEGSGERIMGEAQKVNASAEEKADYFSQAKLNRESARSKKIEILNQMISSEQTDEQTKADAQKDLLDVANATDTEAVCENLIVAKGFESAVVFINDNAATVTVKAENFDDAAAVKIQEIVASNAGIETKYIKIVAV